MELTDLEICKRIAEIEGVEGDTCKVFTKGGVFKCFEYCTDEYEEYNPLTDDALCFQLMVKYEVLREKRRSGKYGAIIADWSNGSPDYYRVEDDSPNRAICLAIIAANE